MPILNYTTTISIEKTTAEIQTKLVKAGAQAVLCEYDDDGIVSFISFRINTPQGSISFRLPSNKEGIYKRLMDDRRVRSGLKTHQQAARVAWRILKDWVEAQLAIIDAEMADVTEIFLPYAQDRKGKTLYEKLRGTNFKLLTES